MSKPVKIIGSGKYLPYQVNSEVIEEKYGMPEGWCLKNSGVITRHHSTDETCGSMGAKALTSALERAGKTLDDLDLIIAGSATFDFPIPSQSSVIKSHLNDGLYSNVGTLDVDSTCLSFVSALDIASKLLDGIQYRTIAIVSSEIASKGLNKTNFETLSLFGDGAAAIIVTYAPNDSSKFIKGGILTFSEGVFDTIIKGGGNAYHPKDHPYNEEMYSFKMNGFKLLKLAKEKIPEFMEWFYHDLAYGLEDVDKIIPHQASKTGLSVFKSLYSFREKQVLENLSTHGNCIAASIPMLLHDSITNGQLQRGDTCMLTGTSAGFSIGGVLIEY